MNPQNPYTPPAGAEAGAPAAETLEFSDYDLEPVSRATNWMRTVSSLQYVIGGLLVVFVGLLVYKGGTAVLDKIPLELASWGLRIVMLFVGAALLRGACNALYDGVYAAEGTPLSKGFGRLRLFLIIFGIWGLLGVAIVVVKLLRAGGAL